MMNLILFCMFILISAVIGVSIAQDPGMLLIAYQHTTVEMPLWLGVILSFIFVFLLYTCIRLVLGVIYAPTELKQWLSERRLRRARRKTVSGFISLIQGHWHQAEKLFISASDQRHTALINFLCAAKAANEQGNMVKRDDYLRQASLYDGRAEEAIGITQATLQMDAGQWEQSLATLQHLYSIYPDHDYILQLLIQVLVELKDWYGMVDLLPVLKKRKIIDEKRIHQLSKQTYIGLLTAASTDHEKKTAWQRIPPAWRMDADLLVLYLPVLLREKDMASVEALIKVALNHEWDRRLVRYYGTIHINDLDRQLKCAEGWLKKHKEDPALMLTLAQLYALKEMWGMAKDYALASLQSLPDPQAHYVLGQIYENLGDRIAAMNHFQLGLAMATQLH